jgi:hypothetical protein
LENRANKVFSRLLSTSCQHQDRSATDSASCIQITHLVAHDKGSPHVYSMLSGGLQQHPRLGLATLAPFVGVMGTVVNGVNAGAVDCELLSQLLVDRLDSDSREVTSSNASLVTYHDYQHAGVIQKANSLGSIGDEAQAIRIIEIINFFINSSIPV